MSKRSKKRNKRYSGEDARAVSSGASQPIVHRYEAVERNKLQEWWQTNKRLVKPVAYIVGGLAIVSWLVFELIQIVF